MCFSLHSSQTAFPFNSAKSSEHWQCAGHHGSTCYNHSNPKHSLARQEAWSHVTDEGLCVSMRIRATACLAQGHTIGQCLLNSGLSAIKAALPFCHKCFLSRCFSKTLKAEKEPPSPAPLEEYSYGQSTAFDSPSHHCRVAAKGRIQ